MISFATLHKLLDASDSPVTVLQPTLSCDRMFELAAGTYTFSLKTVSYITQTNSLDTSGTALTSTNTVGTNDDYTGWSFDICVTPISK